MEVEPKGQLRETVSVALRAGLSLRNFLREAKREYLLQLLHANKYNQVRTARDAEMHRNTLARTCDDLEIDPVAMRPQKKPMQKAVQPQERTWRKTV